MKLIIERFKSVEDFPGWAKPNGDAIDKILQCFKDESKPQGADVSVRYRVFTNRPGANGISWITETYPKDRVSVNSCLREARGYVIFNNTAIYGAGLATRSLDFVIATACLGVAETRIAFVADLAIGLHIDADFFRALLPEQWHDWTELELNAIE